MSAARLQVANKKNTIDQLNFALQRLEDVQEEVFRDIVWQVFCRIISQTPQFSGAAVAHWTIGVGNPNTFYNPALGRQDGKRLRTLSGQQRPLERGNRYWMDVAKRREKPKLASIKKRSKVYITNGVLGDSDGGASGALYLESLQDPAYWSKKLRDVNRPYEVVMDSVAIVMGQWWGKGIDPFKVYVPTGEGA